MTLLLRSVRTLIEASFAKTPLTAAEVFRHEFRVMPFDLDVYGHMNNAKYLNYMEAARWGYQVQTGFLRAALKRGWTGPLTTVHIEYYKPLLLFQKFTVTTQFIAFTDRRYYVLHRFMVGDKETARALIQGSIRKGRANVPPSEYLQTLGFDMSQVSVPEDLAEWFAKLK